MKRIAIFLVILLLSGCVSRKRVLNYLYDHPDVLTELCAKEYPVKEIFLPGIPVVKSEIIPGKVLTCPPSEGTSERKQLKCPDSRIDSIIIHDTIKLENTAKVKLLEASLLQEKELSTKFKTQLADLQKLALALGVVTFLLIVFRKWK